MIHWTSSTLNSIGVLCPQEVDNDAVFQAVKAGDVDGVSYFLEQCEVDLAAADADGNTALHLAILGGHEEIAQALLEKCGSDPKIRDALDACGYTPLMRATAEQNIVLMKALVEVGAGTDDSINLHIPFAHLNREVCIKTALILIEAKGDISEALKFAVDKENLPAALLYFEAGADSLKVLEHVTGRRYWHQMVWMIENRLTRDDQVSQALDDLIPGVITNLARASRKRSRHQH